ncbi:MAG: hypothetical protein M3548_04890, partial [Actinomycetota bacterium]|nr:hypothetical protein [Actinomycetota bacterium]
MTSRTESSDGQDNSARLGRVLLVAVLGLALISVGVLVFTDSVRWLRLGIVAALWAALAGAFLAAKYRRTLADRALDAEELQQVYELELEREVAARREYELEVEAETRRKIAEESRDDLSELRAELKAMRENLEMLFGGEVLVERFALHAEATRMRARGEDVPAVGAARQGNQVRRIAAGTSSDAETEFIERIRVETTTVHTERKSGAASDRWFVDGPSANQIDPDWTPSWEAGQEPDRPAAGAAHRGQPQRRSEQPAAEVPAREVASASRARNGSPVVDDTRKGGRGSADSTRRDGVSARNGAVESARVTRTGVPAADGAVRGAGASGRGDDRAPRAGVDDAAAGQGARNPVSTADDARPVAGRRGPVTDPAMARGGGLAAEA